jgi:hypothetical protein
LAATRRTRGGPNLVRGMGAMRDTLDALGLPYNFFGFDSDMSEVVLCAKQVDEWIFLYPRMLGCAVEIDDHLNCGRNMDTRTPATECRFVA